MTLAAGATTTVRRQAWREETWRQVGGTVFFVAILALVAANVAGPAWFIADTAPGLLFLAQALIFLVAAMAAGVAIKGHPLGVAIDKRNRLSLSKLQMLLWTAIVIPALATLVAYRLAHGLGMDAADIVIPAEVLAAMGIAAGSLAASPAVLSLKPEEGDQRVAVRPLTEKVRLVDLIRGDEEGNKDAIDLSKLQQFAVTLLLIGVYAGVVYSSFASIVWVRGVLTDPPPLRELPALGVGFVQLMAISHAGYLLYKAAPKPSADTPGTASDPAKPQALG
jgi:hypothetical protein